MPYLTDPVVAAGSWGSSPQPVLEGAGLVLRPWRTGDESFLVEAYSDPEIKHWHAFTLTGVSEASALIARWSKRWPDETGAGWAVLGGGKLLGRIGFRVLDLEVGEAEVAYWVAPAARSQGVAGRSVEVLTGWAGEAGLHRLTLLHSTRNEPSCRVARRCGFGLEGTAVRSVLHADGWHDMHLHARLLN